VAKLFVPTKELIDATRKVVKQVLAERPGLSSDQRRARPISGGGAAGTRELVGVITAVFGTVQPTYSARALDFPSITVTKQAPVGRATSSSVEIIAASRGNECKLFKDADGNWQIDNVMGEVMATDDCQALASIRNNMTVSLFTTTPTGVLPITSDLVLADTTLGNITFALPEDEVGKRIAVCNVGNTGNRVSLSNTFYGVSGMIISSFKTTLDFVYTGIDSIGWIIK
jgi:hypothetical protein